MLEIRKAIAEIFIFMGIKNKNKDYAAGRV